MIHDCIWSAARVLTGAHVIALAKGAARRTIGRWFILIVLFVAAESDRVAPTAVETLQLPCIDGQVIGLKVIVFADQRAIGSRGVLLAADFWRCFGFLHDQPIRSITASPIA